MRFEFDSSTLGFPFGAPLELEHLFRWADHRFIEPPETCSQISGSGSPLAVSFSPPIGTGAALDPQGVTRQAWAQFGVGFPAVEAVGTLNRSP
jgi:hypothetical protein